MEILDENKKRIGKALFVLLIILSAYFAVKISTEVRKGSMLGQSQTPATISFSGHGEVQAVPDIANVYFTISKVEKVGKDAQAKVAEKEKQALDFLKSKGVADKDIKTSNASLYPKYDYVRTLCPVMGQSGAPSMQAYDCGNGKQVLTGYEASESITVKVRNIDDAGSIMQGLGAIGVSDLNGPNFAIDKEDALKAQARKKAIDDAKAKAEVLAKDLGVRLTKITGFSESGGAYPMYYAKDAVMASSAPAAPRPAELPKGENTISSDVTITYEIR